MEYSRALLEHYARFRYQKIFGQGGAKQERCSTQSLTLSFSSGREKLEPHPTLEKGEPSLC
jgi:hypothetical protein